jgi:Flp pilus assembly protein TadD
MISAIALAGDDFYQQRLQAGIEAYRAKRLQEAVDELRIAAFGMLEQPTVLLDTLARLALAQQAVGRTADAEFTLNRFIEVERKFNNWGQSQLEPELKKRFEALLREKISSETLLAISSLADLVETEEKRIAKLSRKEKQKALLAAHERDPKNPKWPLELAREAASRDGHKETISWASQTLELDPKNEEALVLRAKALTARKDYEAALRDLKDLDAKAYERLPALNADLFVCQVGAKDWAAARPLFDQIPRDDQSRPDVAAALKKLPKEEVARAEKAAEKADAPVEKATPVAAASGKEEPVPAKKATDPAKPAEDPVAATVAQGRKLTQDGHYSEAVSLLRPAVEKSPMNRELRRTLLEAACLGRDFKLAVTQVSSLEPFSDGEEPWMFYGAVSYYETKNIEAARRLMRRAKPMILSNDFVDYYAKKILSGP